MFISAYEGFQIWDVDPPDEPELLAIGPPSDCQRFAVDGNYIYLTGYFSSDNSFRILKYE